MEEERELWQEKVTQLEDENQLIKWLENIVHQNFKLDAEDIINRFNQVDEEYKNFKWRSSEELTSLKFEVEELKKEKEEVLRKMKKQTDKVVKPLIDQVVER